MKTLITALGFAIFIIAPGFPEPADARAAARKVEPADSCLCGQNEKCYWRGQCDIISDENRNYHWLF
jgi:hypothetical protein